jgi:hypothetical protein
LPWALIGALCLSVATLSLWRCLPGGVVGGAEQPDHAGTLWAMWWVGEAISSGFNPFNATSNLVPTGQAPAAWYNLVDGLLGAPWVAALGPERGYTAAALLFLASAGAAGAALAHRAGADTSGAAVAGVGLMTSPFVILELANGRLAQVLVVFPLLALAGFSALRDGDRRATAVVATGALLSLSALTYWFYGLMVLFGVVLIWLAPGAARRRSTMPPLGGVGAVTALLCGPFVVRLGQRFATLPGVERPLEAWLDPGPLAGGQTSLAFAMADSHGPLWPLWALESDPSDLRLPWVLLALAGAGLLKGGLTRWRWAALALTGWALTLGPWLRSPGGGFLEIPLPWLFLHEYLPFFSRLWWPTRASLLVVPAICVLAALGARAVLRGRPAWVALVPLALLLGELGVRAHYLPVPMGPGRPVDTAFYAKLDGALITTPVMGPSGGGRHLLWLQAWHGMPILGGLGDHLPGHIPKQQQQFIDDNGLLRALRDASDDRMRGGVVTPADIEALQAAGFRWVVVDASVYRPSREGPWSRNFREVVEPVWGRPDVSSRRAVAWEVTAIDSAVTLPALRRVEADLTEAERRGVFLSRPR